ncbi:MAG TPA: 30S ribosomal protein S1 [Mariprofundaceae bacterium]|nr:30S ribosomal protein S1 [Mariprofundaceae bacterium]
MSEHMDTDKLTGAEAAGEESFEALFNASLKEGPVARKGEMIRGMVVSIDGDNVIVDVGAKAEGSIGKDEFVRAGLELPKVGEEIDAIVQSVGGSAGVRLSVLAMRQQEDWSAIEQAVAEGATVEAEVTAEVKGGFRVRVGGLEAFMPRSEADPNPRISASEIVGSRCQVAIIEARRKPENIVVSRKQPLESVLAEQRQALFANLKVGDKVSGTVKRLTDFGAFVDIGGVDALLHVSDIAWQRIDNPAEMLKAGQKVTAEIIKMNPETGKVSISMKALQDDPWKRAADHYEPGMRVTGTVRRLLDFGAVVELEPGIEGLIHRSEMSWTRKDVNPTQVLTEGDVVDVAVLEIDPDARRLRLSLKAVGENPWQTWLAKHPVGSRVTGKIKNITDFGFFVPVADDLDGLVHMENLSWEQDGAEAMQAYQKGQEVECVVLGVDVERQRISLGIKQISADPFELFLAGVKKGSSVSGKVVDVKSGGATIELVDGVMANLSMREVPRDHDEIKVGSEIEAKIIDVNRRRRQVELSIRQQLRDEEREAVSNYSRSVQEEKAPSALALELQRKLLAKGNTPSKS